MKDQDAAVKIFDMVRQGKSIRDITKELDNVPSRSSVGRYSKLMKSLPTSVRDIFLKSSTDKTVCGTTNVYVRMAQLSNQSDHWTAYLDETDMLMLANNPHTKVEDVERRYREKVIRATSKSKEEAQKKLEEYKRRVKNKKENSLELLAKAIRESNVLIRNNKESKTYLTLNEIMNYCNYEINLDELKKRLSEI